MVKTTEGVIISSSAVSSSQYSGSVAQHLPQFDADLNSLPRITRRLFIEDIQKALGDLETESLPISLKPVLAELLALSEEYLNDGDEQVFMDHCLDAIEQCSKGWSYLSYWISTEQSLCYSIYWGLRAAIEKHQKQMTMYLGSKNDGLPRNDSDPPLTPDPKIASINDWLNQKRKTEVSSNQSFFSTKLLQSIGGKAKTAQNSLMQQYACDGLNSLDQFANVQNHINRIINNKKA